MVGKIYWHEQQCEPQKLFLCHFCLFTFLLLLFFLFFVLYFFYFFFFLMFFFYCPFHIERVSFWVVEINLWLELSKDVALYPVLNHHIIAISFQNGNRQRPFSNFLYIHTYMYTNLLFFNLFEITLLGLCFHFNENLCLVLTTVYIHIY